MCVCAFVCMCVHRVILFSCRHIYKWLTKMSEILNELFYIINIPLRAFWASNRKWQFRHTVQYYHRFSIESCKTDHWHSLNWNARFYKSSILNKCLSIWITDSFNASHFFHNVFHNVFRNIVLNDFLKSKAWMTDQNINLNNWNFIDI